jgi:Bax protein|tara:strand:- start:1156 stop:1866 length:711 start_codon:yes stop_codon:yes gene_type:complete
MKMPKKGLIKKWTIITVIGAMAMAGAFAYGTFKPNYIIKKDMKETLELEHAKWANSLGLHSPDMNYTNGVEFIGELNKCVDYLNFTTPPHERVPLEMLVAQAALESAWGKSRFAVKANNLFGIRVFKKEKPHLLPLGVDKWTGWGVRIFETKCDSVKEYLRILNTHPAYIDFRELRNQMLKANKPLDAKKLIKTLKAFSTTEDYDMRVINMMKKIKKALNSLEEKKDEKVLPEDKP